MFENQVEEYIAKALFAEAKADNEFLNESELAFRVTGMMYAYKIKSDGPVSLRSVKGKMGKVRTLCDEASKILLPQVEVIEDVKTITGWKIASGADLEYIAQTYLCIKPAKTDAKAETADAPEAEK